MKYFLFTLLSFILSVNKTNSDQCGCPNTAIAKSAIATIISVENSEKLLWHSAESIREYLVDENGLEYEKDSITCVSDEVCATAIATNATLFVQDGSGEKIPYKEGGAKIQAAIVERSDHFYALTFNAMGEIITVDEVTGNYVGQN